MQRAALREPIRHPEALALERRITLGALQAEALRLREIHVKEAFTLVDRDGRFFRASLTALGRSSAEAIVYEAMPASTESQAHITLFCAVLARQRMLGVIQKATELGVMRIVPVLSERSVPEEGLAHEKAHAWPAQAIRACRQCRRASVPEICEPMPLAAAFEDPGFRTADLRVHLDDRAARPFTPSRASGPLRIAFAVGPEGGFTDSERAAFDAHGFSPLRLGGRVLRAETAVLAGLVVLQQTYGDMGALTATPGRDPG